MDKTIGVLGCSGAVGRNVIEHLEEKYHILGGQRSPITFSADNVEWVQTDIYQKESLRAFCEKCDVVINAAGPSSKIKWIVAECAAEVGVDYVDTSGESIFIERDRDIFRKSKQSFIIGAGLEAGLSGLLPYHLVKDFDVVLEADCYFGSRQRISPSSLADLLCSCFIDSGYANACYQKGKIVHMEVPSDEKQKILGFREEIYRKPYISNEIITMAEQCGIERVNWYHAIADSQTIDILTSLFSGVTDLKGDNLLDEMVEKYMNVFDAIANTKPLFNSMLYDFTGIKNGKKIRKATVCQVVEAYRVCGIMSALAAEYVLTHEVKNGVSWVCEILDAKAVIDLLMKEKAIEDYKTIDLPVGELKIDEVEDGEL